MKFLKKNYSKLASLRRVSKGYVYTYEQMWQLDKKEDHRQHKRTPKKTRDLAHKYGYKSTVFTKFKLNESNLKNFVSHRDYLYIMPINKTYQKWLKNLVILHSILQPYHNKMLTYYYHLSFRDGKRFIIPLNKESNTFDYEDLKELLIEKKSLHVITTKNNFVCTIYFKNNKFYLNRTRVSFKNLISWIENSNSEFLITENYMHKFNIASIYRTQKIKKLILYVSNENGNNPKILDAICTEKGNVYPPRYHNYSVDLTNGTFHDGKSNIKCWDEINELINDIGLYLPQLEFMGVIIKVYNNKFYIENIVNTPDYFEKNIPSTELTTYLQKKLSEKRNIFVKKTNIFNRGNKIVKRFIRKKFAETFYPAGLKPYLSYTWISDILKDFKTQKEISFKDKIYAYKNGFFSYRLVQYNITEKTRKNHISDFEYKWLRHINSHYRVWLEDKNTLKYIVLKYKNVFPDYYYYIRHKDDNTQIVGLMDCKRKDVHSFQDVINLIKEKKIIALKPDEGSHGDGFYRCEFIDDKFYLNFKESNQEEILEILSKKENSYIITEYIQMHDDLKKIYDGSVNTLRAIVFKSDGRTPTIGNVYMRIGTSQTGAIDNTSAGGMFAAVDEVTGQYGNAKRFVDGNIVDCPRHPDTNVLIEGILPNWEKTKKLILNVATELKELEFFGFDLAITNDGIKIPEINRSPDFPKIEKYTKKTNDYLLYKLERKKEMYGYENNQCKKLIKLPKR